MKKSIVCVLALFAVAGLMFARGGQDGGRTRRATAIQVATNCEDPTFSAVQDIINKFMQEHPDIRVEYATYTKDYENLLNARMAANDLPDVFATHGWAVKSYTEYLLPLNNLSFANRLTDSVRRIVTTSGGDVVALPITVELGGICYNKDVLARAGWDHVPETFDEFLAACEDVKRIGIAPVFIAGKDSREPARLMDLVAPAFLVTYPNEENSKSLLDGTFDWSKWSRVADFLKTLSDRGYLNVDANTADPIYKGQKLADGSCAFLFANPTFIEAAWTINSDANLSFMPIPAWDKNDTPYLIGGERETYGIWKDSPNTEAATTLLEYLARPENIKYISEKCAMPSGFSDVEVNLRLAGDYTKYSSLRIIPYFDREWLPNGMWATMRSTGSGIISNEITITEACDLMKQSYLNLLAQQ